ncbi:DUF6864 domain-containing function [Lysinibacillus pakistanensis]|uniref:DUF6864 domain-containing function n=1 Tax=Lysinibacillus pakistanensis TaxID=759811 RepID=UPI003D2C9275
MRIVNVNINNVEVLDSGTIIQYNNQPIEFDFNLPNFPMKLIMDFKDKNGNSNELNAESDIINETTLKLTFYNYNNPLGTGSTKPIHIATYQGKPLYVNYRIHSLNDSMNKTIHYTFYLSEEKL